jgi:hypothetical protein
MKMESCSRIVASASVMEVPSAGGDNESDKLKFRTGPAGQIPPQEVNGAPGHNIIVLFIMFSLLLSAMWGDLTAPVPVALRANAGDSRRGRVHRAVRENSQRRHK